MQALNNSRKLIIIGAGPAGLTASYKASEAGIESVVLEKDLMVGGISRTVEYKGYFFDIGGHRFFTKLKPVEEMWKQVLGEDLLTCSRLSRIYFNNEFFLYPLRLSDAIPKLGVWKSFMALCSYFYYHIFPMEPEESFENWIINRFGNRLYSTFFKVYTEKVLGIPCSELRAEWAVQRINGLSLMVALKNALIGNLNSKSISKTLIHSFYYPKLGPGMMWQRVCDAAIQNGSSILLGTEVEGVQLHGNRVEALEIRRDGQIEILRGTDFISSMPIKELIEKIKPPVPDEVFRAADKLRYRDFILVALIVNRSTLFPDNWIYIHDPSFKVGRIQNFKNWSSLLVPDQAKTCLGMEYFCSRGDSLWEMSDEELVNLGAEEISRLGLAKADEVEEGHVVRMPKAYPIYDSAYEKSVTAVREFVDTIENFQLVGRNGMHRYNNQDRSMMTAILAVENLQGASHNLWEVNEELEDNDETTDQTEDMQELIGRTFSRMDKLGFATALGLVFGMFIFLATIFIAVAGDKDAVYYLQLIENYYVGYSVTVTGAFIGLAYGFVWGFLFGWLFAYLRNFFFAIYIFRVKRRLELISVMDFFDHF